MSIVLMYYPSYFSLWCRYYSYRTR